MILTFVGIQTTCVIIAATYVIKHLTPKKAQLKVSIDSKTGFKHYKTF